MMNKRPALDGIRVIDFGQFISAPMVAMMLADFGADVIRIDPPGGPRWNDPANAILQRGKRSIVLDLKHSDDLATARALIGTADIVIENFRPGVMARLGLDASGLTDEFPDLVWCALPGFGSGDPRASLPAWEGVVCAAAGLYPNSMFNTVGPPTFSAIPLASFFGGIVAAHAVAAALFHRERTGRGQHIEIPLFEASFEAIACYGENPFSGDSAGMRALLAKILHPAMMKKYRGRDGRFVSMSPPVRPWLKLQSFMIPEDMFDKRDADSIAAVVKLLTAKYATRTAHEWERFFQEEFGLCAAAVQSTKDWLEEDRHARDSRCVIELVDPVLGPTLQAGFGLSLSETPPLASPRHECGADGDAIRRELEERKPRQVRKPTGAVFSAALEGVKVLDISLLLAGPTGARILANYGADVIKVSNPLSLSPDVDPLSDDAVALMGHVTVNDSKKSTLINLKHPMSKMIVEKMLGWADVVHQNFTVGVTERLGAGEADARIHNPGVIYSSSNLHAHGGLRHKDKGHEELGQMATGLMERLSGDGEELIRSPILINDHGTGHLAAFGIIVSLFHQHRTGEGQHVRTALAQTSSFAQLPYMLSFSGKTWDEPRGPGARGWGPLNRLYGSQDGHFFLAALGEDALETLATVNGLNGITDLCGEALEKELEVRFATLPASTWAGRINAVGLGAHIYRPIHDLMEDPWAKHRGLSVVKQPAGLPKIRTVGLAGTFSATPPASQFTVSAAGLDTVEVMERLGLGDKVGELFDAEAISLG
jgi:crotonobetainyl-CoA:carnitine CoA-transferase CaiB-like acyl-CoA transferase